MKALLSILILSALYVPALAIDECIINNDNYPCLEYISNKMTCTLEAKDKCMIHRLKVKGMPTLNKSR